MTQRIAHTRKQAAEMTGLSEQTIARVIKAGELEAKLVGSRILIGHNELMAWFDALPTAEEAF